MGWWETTYFMLRVSSPRRAGLILCRMRNVPFGLCCSTASASSRLIAPAYLYYHTANVFVLTDGKFSSNLFSIKTTKSVRRKNFLKSDQQLNNCFKLRIFSDNIYAWTRHSPWQGVELIDVIIGGSGVVTEVAEIVRHHCHRPSGQSGRR